MNGSNGHNKEDFSGVWALIGLTGGVNILGRFMPMVMNTPSAPPHAQSTYEKLLETEKWIALDQAYTFMLISGSAQGQPVFAEICMPYGQCRDEKQPVSIQVCNIVSTMFFDDMGEATRRTMEKHISDARRKIVQMRAATAGITVASR